MEIKFGTDELVYILRLVLSCVCGILIGLERKNRSKEAGIRTHCVVACGAALMMIISKYGFIDVGGDGARIAAQVVSGIGFLGAGMIFVHRNTITGLTTAAGIWATSGIGLAIGGGMYVVGVAATLILLTMQILLHLNFRSHPTSRKRLEVTGVTEADFFEGFKKKLSDLGIEIHETDVEKNSFGKKYSFIIESPAAISEEELVCLTEHDCSVRNV